jgi:hemerythrin-like metal-binding protein
MSTTTTAHPTPPSTAQAQSTSTAVPQPPAGLSWVTELQTGDTRMDDTHEEFVAMLNTLLVTPPRDQLPLYREFLAHTVAHFEQEERWMVATGFSADNCHATHHATILDTMRAVEAHYLQGDNDIIQRLAEALVEWFPQHAASMDAGLALHLKDVGFDSHTETLADPSKVRAATMSGCGSVSCS